MRVNEELLPKSLPVRSAGSIDEGAQRERDESENLPLGHHHVRSNTAVRSGSAENRVAPPILSTKSAGSEKDDDRTPTSQVSFWEKE